MAKYKRGDYIAAPSYIYFKIVCVIDEDTPIYGVTDIKSHSRQLGWVSEWDLDDKKYTKSEPKFEKFKNIKPGDTVTIIGDPTEERIYIGVLAKVDSAVLLSATPRKEAKMLLDIDQFFREEHGEGLLSDKDRQHFRGEQSTFKLSKMAGEWMDVTTMALMNWDILERE